MPIAQVAPHDVAEEAIGGMLAGKRSVVPGIVPKVVSTGGRFVPRTLLLPGIRIGNRFRGGPRRCRGVHRTRSRTVNSLACPQGRESTRCCTEPLDSP